LHPNDGKTVFIGWGAFLIAGMQGTNPAARAVQLYLLQMERAGRVAGTIVDIIQNDLFKAPAE